MLAGFADVGAAVCAEATTYEYPAKKLAAAIMPRAFVTCPNPEIDDFIRQPPVFLDVYLPVS